MAKWRAFKCNHTECQLRSVFYFELMLCPHFHVRCAARWHTERKQHPSVGSLVILILSAFIWMSNQDHPVDIVFVIERKQQQQQLFRLRVPRIGIEQRAIISEMWRHIFGGKVLPNQAPRAVKTQLPSNHTRYAVHNETNEIRNKITTTKNRLCHFTFKFCIVFVELDFYAAYFVAAPKLVLIRCLCFISIVTCCRFNRTTTYTSSNMCMRTLPLTYRRTQTDGRDNERFSARKTSSKKANTYAFDSKELYMLWMRIHDNERTVKCIHIRTLVSNREICSIHINVTIRCTPHIWHSQQKHNNNNILHHAVHVHFGASCSLPLDLLFSFVRLAACFLVRD